MALGFQDPVTWGIVFVAALVLEVVVVMNIRAQDGGKGGYRAATEAPTLAEGEALTDVLSRFVHDKDGDRIGETVGVDGAKVIVKDAGTYRAVPREALLNDGEGGFKVEADIDWDAATKDGDAWRERQHKEITYSDDELPEEERPGAAS